MKKKKLLYIVNVDWFFVSHRLPIAIRAVEEGYEVHIAASLTDGRAALESKGFFVHEVEIDRGNTGCGDIVATFVRMYSVIKRVKPDIVHLVTIKPVLLGGIAARLARVRGVVAAISGLGHIFIATGYKAVFRRIVVSFLYRVALGVENIRVIFQNSYDMESLVRIARLQDSKTIIIRGSGVDLSEYVPRPFASEPCVVVLAARLLKDKGVREFVDAARILKKHGVVARFCLVGAPDKANPNSCTESELESWVAEGVIEYWGLRTDMPAVLSAAHIIVLPSYYGEGVPKILLEAAASGRAVITTNWPGCRDAIESNVTGILVPVRDSSALAAAIERLVADIDLCVSMGEAGRRLAEREFGISKVVERHLRIYSELLESA